VSVPGVLVAHRAANAPDTLRAAAGRVDVVEADVHLFRGRLEVRHAKTLGPLPVLWEKWHLLARDTPRPVLGDLLRAAAPLAVDLMLDLKGPDPRLPGALERALGGWTGERRVIVCSRIWRTVDRLRTSAEVRALHSVGSPRELRALARRYGPGALEGVSVDHRLLTPAAVEALRQRTDLVWAWIVDDPARAALLARWGVTGFISDTPGALRCAAP
jgi:glycerophosphoryl diester phosphodiesterase